MIVDKKIKIQTDLATVLFKFVVILRLLFIDSLLSVDRTSLFFINASPEVSKPEIVITKIATSVWLNDVYQYRNLF